MLVWGVLHLPIPAPTGSADQCCGCFLAWPPEASGSAGGATWRDQCCKEDPWGQSTRGDATKSEQWLSFRCSHNCTSLFWRAFPYHTCVCEQHCSSTHRSLLLRSVVFALGVGRGDDSNKRQPWANASELGFWDFNIPNVAEQTGGWAMVTLCPITK